MLRRPLKRKEKFEGIPAWKVGWFKAGEVTPTGNQTIDDEVDWAFLAWHTQQPDWELCKDEIMSDWPLCSRPFAWYEFSAPRQNDGHTKAFYHGTLPEPRKQVGGGGKLCKWNFVSAYHSGVFKYWHFKNNPSLIESEAAYLQRLNLLTAKGKKHLESHPD